MINLKVVWINSDFCFLFLDFNDQHKINPPYIVFVWHKVTSQKKDTFMLLLDLDISQNRPFVFLSAKCIQSSHVCVCMFRFANIRAVTSGMSACIGMAMHVAGWCQRKPWDERVWIMSWGGMESFRNPIYLSHLPMIPRYLDIFI